MNFTLVYSVKVALYLTAFYLVYSIFLKRDTAYGRNRAFILITVFASFILPFITFSTSKPLDIAVFGKLLSEVKITRTATETGTVMEGPYPVIFTIYISGVILFLSRLFIDFVSLVWVIARKKNPGSRIIRFNRLNTAAFSAMGHIFINTKLSPEDAGEIIRHEKNHLRQNHYLDIIFMELVTAFQWFNPFIYLFNREIRAIHEYQADQGCLSSGISVVNYQMLLMSQVFRTGSIKLTNSFSNPSLIRKRMIMMTKKPSSELAGYKMLSAVPVAGLVFLLVSATPLPPPPPPPPPPSAAAITSDENEVPFVVVEEMPMYPGGDAELLKDISAMTVYPESAKQNNIQGRVIIKFCVTSKGTVSQVSILKGVEASLDNEALRVVSNLKKFIPGRQGGKAVPVWYMVPITFTLK